MKTGILLVNLGTPDAPTSKAVNCYLKQFLSDPRVIDLPRWKWAFLLNWIILPKRSPRVAKLYQSVWTEEGSPLLAIAKQQQTQLQQRFDRLGYNVKIEIAMTYGNPSVANAVERLMAEKVDKIIVLPLFPQYSSTTTAAVFDAFTDAFRQRKDLLPFEFIHSYQDNPYYINALAESIQAELQPEQYLLFSFHGIPLRYQSEGDYYAQHCQQTAELVAKKLGLASDRWQVAYQSRFGKEEWLKPYTDETLEHLAQSGVKNIAVVCPGFANDCLETLEEIAVENRENFLSAGGENYHYIPALNATDSHIEMIFHLLEKRL
ncbi:ferrochelatase [Mergibacter septicus]|uniref:Ferrochelatase n=1 Tax=Mergibacter septicus TaxID=221402 RepID=A0A8D4LJN1_9PAST|nr:ferrochelatase [Mergibacter septicus]AWX15715.1 ferrochelatase [Mergibacter septicus]QDJ14968.1 ferrochelatase [Mergibacter septicus]UTU47607.1 ferrochelatase [Mergibacter septicus]WMR96787.1 ferrochelatase [Mergibacter septicus]